MKKWIRVGLLVVACLVISWITLHRKPGEERQFQPEMFWSYRMWLRGDPKGKDAVVQNLNNILLFVPFGLLFPKKNWTSVLIGAAVFSIIIEVSQWIFKLGLAEFDDVISNTLGVAIGFIFWLCIAVLLRRLCRLEKRNES